jgi:hypothetical protein
VKNLNPALGPGETKLRARYIGPFRIIKAYPSSLVVVPWTENARLEEYYKDPNLFRYMHRGDIKPFYTKQVSARDCKPYKAMVKRQDVVDPIVLNKFLTNLRLSDNDELLSVRDIQPDDKSSYDSYGSQTSIRSSQSKQHSFNNRRNSESDFSDSDDSRPDQNPVQNDPGLVINPALPVVQPQAQETRIDACSSSQEFHSR